MVGEASRHGKPFKLLQKQLAEMRGGLTAEEYRWKLIKRGR